MFRGKEASTRCYTMVLRRGTVNNDYTCGVGFQKSPSEYSIIVSAFHSYLIGLVVCIAASVGAGIRFGRAFAIGAAIAAALLSASWFHWELNAVPFNVQTSTAALVMLAFCIHSGRRIRSPLVLLDILMAGLVGWHIVCDSVQQGFDPFLPLAAYGEWALPYVTGRFAVMHQESIAKLAPWFAIAGIGIAAAAISESLTGVNAWEAIFTPVDDLVRTNRSKRYDVLYRALGPTRHPIFLAVVLLLLIPWSVAWHEVSSGKQRWFGIGGLVALAVGILSTVSRGPVAAGVIGLGFFGATLHRGLRYAILVLVLLAGGVGWIQRDSLLRWLELGGETRRTIVEYEGENVVYSGTRNRLYVVQIYAPLVWRSGVFGYGSEATASFPPNIPGLPTDPRSRERLGVVDNAYLNVGLRFGVVGLALYAGLLLTAVARCLALREAAGTTLYPAGPLFVTAQAATLVAVASETMTVFLSYDYAFWLLFTLGVVAGIDVRSRRVSRGES